MNSLILTNSLYSNKSFVHPVFSKTEDHPAAYGLGIGYYRSITKATTYSMGPLVSVQVIAVSGNSNFLDEQGNPYEVNNFLTYTGTVFGGWQFVYNFTKRKSKKKYFHMGLDLSLGYQVLHYTSTFFVGNNRVDLNDVKEYAYEKESKVRYKFDLPIGYRFNHWDIGMSASALSGMDHRAYNIGGAVFLKTHF